MRALLGGLRSLLSLLAIVVWFALGTPVWYFVALPAIWLFPQRRVAIVSRFMRYISRGILFLLSAVGGARFELRGRIPTDRPMLALMNHQSLVDIPTVTVMAWPYAPAFVARSRYARFIPLVSPCIRWLGCPVIDPKRDPRGAMQAIEDAARRNERAFLVFPEGHRSLDGEIRPWRVGGTLAALRGRRVPIYLVVTDGVWAGRRVVELALNVHRMRGVTEVLGPFEPPEDEQAQAAFLEGLRDTLVARLRERRAGASAQ